MTVSRAEHERALARMRLPASVRQVISALHTLVDWTTGRMREAISAARLAELTGMPLRTVQWARGVAVAIGLLVVVARGPLHEPVYALSLPGREPPRAEVADAAPAPPPPPPEPPPAPARRSLAARMFAGVAAAIVAAGGALAAGDLVAAPPAVLARDMREAYIERPVKPEAEPEPPSPEPPPDLAEHLADARHVGPLYASRADAARARAEAQRHDRPSDAAPHRAVILELRRLYREHDGRQWRPSPLDHRLLSMLLRAFGLTPTIALLRHAFEPETWCRRGIAYVPNLVDIAVNCGVVRPGWLVGSGRLAHLSVEPM